MVLRTVCIPVISVAASCFVGRVGEDITKEEALALHSAV